MAPGSDPLRIGAWHHSSTDNCQHTVATMNKNAGLYALGTILLGAVGIYFGKFALQWQPVPDSVGSRELLAYVSGAVLVLGGGAILSRKFERAGALVLAMFYGLWTLTLNLPVAIAGWTHIGAWNSPAEITFLTMGAVALLSASAGAMRGTLVLVARFLAGASAIVFGLAHFNWADFTASMVPAWIPYPLFWAYATGAGHLAAGLAFVSGIKSRLAATCLAFMMGSFVLLLHLPRVIANPEKHDEWIMLAVSASLTGAAVLLRKYVF
jgi:uncharacterized membrane protein YphA (DoxX/SURF4 family)